MQVRTVTNRNGGFRARKSHAFLEGSVHELKVCSRCISVHDPVRPSCNSPAVGHVQAVAPLFRRLCREAVGDIQVASALGQSRVRRIA